MSKPVWYCQKVGIDGAIAVRVDMNLSSGTLGYAQYIHPFQLDNAIDPKGMFSRIIAEMSEVMGRAGALPLSASRVRAFGDLHEQARA